MNQEPIKIKIARKFRPLFLNRFMEKGLKKSLYYFPNNKVLYTLVPTSLMHKKDQRRQVSISGIKMELNLKHYNDHFTYWFSSTDLFLKNTIKVIQPNDVVIDVGINIGNYLLHFAQKATSGSVHGFEPNIEVFNYVKKNCSLNSFKNIYLNNFGLGNSSSTFEMAQINENLGMNKIVASGTLKNTFSIQVERFDDYVIKNNISTIDVVKIDVEGFEMNVLLGAEESINKWKPFLFVEIDDENLKLNNASFKIMQKWLQEKDYVIMNAITLKELKATEIIKHFDILAVHKTKLNYYKTLLD